MPEFEPTADQLRDERGSAHAAEGADPLATHDAPVAVEMPDAPAPVGTRDVPVAVETQEDAPVRETSDDAVAKRRETSAVDRALEELDRLAERDLAEHPDVYQRIHADLRDALAAIDDA